MIFNLVNYLNFSEEKSKDASSVKSGKDGKLRLCKENSHNVVDTNNVKYTYIDYY